MCKYQHSFFEGLQKGSPHILHLEGLVFFFTFLGF